MEDILSFDNILGEDDVNVLFSDPEDAPSEEETSEPSEEAEGKEEKEKKNITEVVNPEELFSDEEPESVGNGKNKEGKEEEDTDPDEGSGTSPSNFYSSIASALAVDGVFPNLNEDDVKKADTAEALSDLIEAEVNARLDEKQMRVAKALENGVEPSEIQKHENAIKYLANITEAAVAEESDTGEQIRKQLIYQDFLNKGYTHEKAVKLTNRTVDAGTDVEDAKEALQSLKEFYQGHYNQLLKVAQQEADAERERARQEQDKLKNSMMKDKDLMGDLEISNDIRKKAFDAVTKPVYKDPETGQYLNAIQNFERQHKGEFLKYAGLFFALTNGFKDFDSFTKGKVKKEVRKGLRDLENVLNTTNRDAHGNFKMVSSRNDPESWLDGDIKLAL